MAGLATSLATVVLIAGVAWAQVPSEDFARRLVDAALERTTHDVTYDGSYRRLAYPGGDVPDDIGVCTDVVIRAFRGVGIDLQVAVHEDMSQEFAAYPKNWGHDRPDPNIDHRRVPNLQTFLSRRGTVLSASTDPADYLPGDLVTWRLPGDLPHIGIVVSERSADGGRPLIVHNIGAGPTVEDALFEFPITGHFRYSGPAPDRRTLQIKVQSCADEGEAFLFNEEARAKFASCGAPLVDYRVMLLSSNGKLVEDRSDDNGVAVLERRSLRTNGCPLQSAKIR